MELPSINLKEFRPEKEFFIGIDSDGCVFDSMELKHKECFCPAFIKHFDLQPVSKYAREVWDFVNLYSASRGCNRFHAVVKALDWLSERSEMRSRGISLPAYTGLRSWVEKETKLGNPALEEAVRESGDPDLKRTLLWSQEVNRVIGEMVNNLPPFPYVEECLGIMKEQADTMVVSATPSMALEKEWQENNIKKYVRLIAGQEQGKKSEHIQSAAGGKYLPEKILMIGDSPGDYKAAKDNKALFYPINPGQEVDSWRELSDEGLKRFFGGSFAGEYQERLLKEFNTLLPETPFWKEQA